MTHNTKPISPLRRRMLEDMTLRKLSPKTQATYIRAVINFTRFIKRCPSPANLSVHHPYCKLRNRPALFYPSTRNSQGLLCGGHNAYQTKAITDSSCQRLAGRPSEEPVLQMFPLTI
jgi:hypothetical protein